MLAPTTVHARCAPALHSDATPHPRRMQAATRLVAARACEARSSAARSCAFRPPLDTALLRPARARSTPAGMRPHRTLSSLGLLPHRVLGIGLLLGPIQPHPVSLISPDRSALFGIRPPQFTSLRARVCAAADTTRRAMGEASIRSELRTHSCSKRCADSPGPLDLSKLSAQLTQVLGNQSIHGGAQLHPPNPRTLTQT
jgi:hypothetical protein